MKIAISTGEENVRALLNPRFGRCEFFALYDTETKEWKFIPNSGSLEGKGAGIKAAQLVIEQNVDVLLTGDLGPNAADLIAEAGIKVYSLPEITLEEAVAEFEKGNLAAAPAESAPSNSQVAVDQQKGDFYITSGRLAIATEGENVAQHFGRCQAYTIVDIVNGKEVNNTVTASPGHQPGFLPRFLGEKGVNCVIAGGMGPRAQNLFIEQGIFPVIGVTGTVKDAVKDFLSGNLAIGESLCQQGQPGHNHGCEGHDHEHGHEHGHGCHN